MSKSTKKYSNMNLANILTPISHKNNNIGNSPFNISNKKSFKNNLERINKFIKKETSSKKNKEKFKNNEALINNFLSQRVRLNTEENDANIQKIKFSYNFLRNKIDNIFKPKNTRSNSKKVNFKSKNLENNNNFRTSKKIHNTKNSEHINKKSSNKNNFTKLIGNSNKKLIEENSYNNEYNITKIHNHSNTQINFLQASKRFSNSTHKLKSYSSKYRGKNKYEDIKRKKLNNRLLTENKISNKISGAIRQISPFYISNNKKDSTQKYLKSVPNKISNNKAKELKNKNKSSNNDFIMKENSSYLVISKKPTQITNFIEKKENNKYINNFFNICENNKEQINNDSNNQCISFEEIHFFFVKQIQTGNKLNAFIKCNKS